MGRGGAAIARAQVAMPATLSWAQAALQTHCSLQRIAVRPLPPTHEDAITCPLHPGSQRQTRPIGIGSAKRSAPTKALARTAVELMGVNALRGGHLLEARAAHAASFQGRAICLRASSHNPWIVLG